MAEKLPCTAVEKRKPLGIFWLEFCKLARGAPRRPLGAAERIFYAISPWETEKSLDRAAKKPRKSQQASFPRFQEKRAKLASSPGEENRRKRAQLAV